MTAVALPRATGGRWRLVRSGARDITPLVVGVAPIAVAIGAAISAADISPVAGWAAGPLIVGGAAQLLTIQMLDAGSVPFAIVISALLVNARVLAYGAALAPWFREATLGQRLLVAIPLIDPTFFTATARFERGDLDQSARLAYYAGAGGFLMLAWMAIQALVVAVGSSLPESSGLHLAAPLALGGLLAKTTVGRPATVAAVAAAGVAVLGTALPFQIGASLGLVAGIICGMIVLRRAEDRENQDASS